MWNILKSTASVKTTLLIILAFIWCGAHRWLENYIDNRYLIQIAPNQFSDGAAREAYNYHGILAGANNLIFLLGLLTILILVIRIYRKKKKNGI